MEFKITDRAETELSKIESKTFRVIYDDNCG